MIDNWSTKDKDLHIARVIMEEYANDRDTTSLGLFEIVVDQVEKKMNFRLSGWVLMLAKYFTSTYGAAQGDLITRQVISCCIIQDATLH